MRRWPRICRCALNRQTRTYAAFTCACRGSPPRLGWRGGLFFRSLRSTAFLFCGFLLCRYGRCCLPTSYSPTPALFSRRWFIRLCRFRCRLFSKCRNGYLFAVFGRFCTFLLFRFWLLKVFRNLLLLALPLSLIFDLIVGFLIFLQFLLFGSRFALGLTFGFSRFAFAFLLLYIFILLQGRWFLHFVVVGWFAGLLIFDLQIFLPGLIIYLSLFFSALLPLFSSLLPLLSGLSTLLSGLSALLSGRSALLSGRSALLPDFVFRFALFLLPQLVTFHMIRPKSYLPLPIPLLNYLPLRRWFFIWFSALFAFINSPSAFHSVWLILLIHFQPLLLLHFFGVVYSIRVLSKIYCSFVFAYKAFNSSICQ